MRSKNHKFIAALTFAVAGLSAIVVSASSLSSQMLTAANASDSNTAALKPYSCTINGALDIDIANKKCAIKITVTAPEEGRDDDYNYFPMESFSEIKLYRSEGWSDDILIKTWENCAANEVFTYVDTDPTLVSGTEYTYMAVAYNGDIAGNNSYSYVTFGITPVEPDAPVLTTNDGDAPVNIKFTCPAAEYGSWWDATPFPEGMTYTSIKLYKKNNDGSENIIKEVQNPEPGAEYTATDATPSQGQNYYYVKTVTDFGESSAAQAYVFIGDDYPARVTDVTATETPEGILVSWTAPTEGYNGGRLDPTTLKYRVYRADNNSGSNLVLLTDANVSCTYTDNLEGIEKEQLTYYRVVPYNNVEAPANTYNYGDTYSGILVGPPAPLPYIESFNAGSKFNKNFSNMWEDNFGYQFSTHYIRNSFTVDMADGAQFEVNAGVDGGTDADETGADAFFVVTSSSYSTSSDPGYLTSGSISFADATNPILQFSYMPVANSTAKMDVEVYTGKVDEENNPIFTKIHTLDFSTDASDEHNWTKVSVPMTDFAGEAKLKVRFKFYYPEATGRYAMLIDDVVINDYPSVSDIAIEESAEGLKLTWGLPGDNTGRDVKFDVYLNDELLLTTTDCSYIYKEAEKGETYRFAVQAVYGEIKAPVVTLPDYTVVVDEFTVKGLLYRVTDNGGVSVAGYETVPENLVIPAKVEFKGVSYDVEYLLPNTFQGARALKTATIEAAITELPMNYFYGCTNMTSLTLPEGLLTIYDKAMFGCAALTGFTLPESVEIIEASAFEKCLQLKSVSFGEKMKKIGSRAFADCSSLASVEFKGSEVPEVGEDAFINVASPCNGTCPESAIDAYAAEKALEPITFPTAGITGIEAEEGATVEYYNLKGLRIDAPSVGQPVIVRIRRANGEVKTVKTVTAK